MVLIEIVAIMILLVVSILFFMRRRVNKNTESRIKEKLYEANKNRDDYHKQVRDHRVSAKKERKYNKLYVQEYLEYYLLNFFGREYREVESEKRELENRLFHEWRDNEEDRENQGSMERANNFRKLYRIYTSGDTRLIDIDKEGNLQLPDDVTFRSRYIQYQKEQETPEMQDVKQMTL